MLEQLIVFGVIAAVLASFVGGWLRYELVALLALLVVAGTGILEPEEVFAGFSNPAVVTVAAVLVISRALASVGMVELMVRWLRRVGDRPSWQVGALGSIILPLSAFINNTGALALLMPVAIRISRNAKRPASLLLMPLAFASLLGGMTTLIGTPTNLIISSYRRDLMGRGFAVFDFAPVGLGVALAGLAFISLLGWRLMPRRPEQLSREEMFRIADYLAELRVLEDARVLGSPLGELPGKLELELTVLGLVREERRWLAPSPYERLRAGDILIVEADAETLKTLDETKSFELVGNKKLGSEDLRSDDISLIEAVVRPESVLIGRTARSLGMRWRYGLNLLAVARQGRRLGARLGDVMLRAGDVILVQGPTKNLHETVARLGSLPLSEEQPAHRAGKLVPAVALFVAGVAVAALALLPVEVALASTAALTVLFGFLSPREAYAAIEWPVIFLLASLLPLGQALENSGGAALLSSWLVALGNRSAAVVMLAVVLLASMALANLINVKAAAVLMAPIAIGVAQGAGLSADPFLLAVALGCDASFLTPTGHQCNTLVLGPGGYKFSDYWRLGLPLSLLVLLLSLPLLLLFWPFAG